MVDVWIDSSIRVKVKYIIMYAAENEKPYKEQTPLQCFYYTFFDEISHLLF